MLSRHTLHLLGLGTGASRVSRTTRSLAFCFHLNFGSTHFGMLPKLVRWIPDKYSFLPWNFNGSIWASQCRNKGLLHQSLIEFTFKLCIFTACISMKLSSGVTSRRGLMYLLEFYHSRAFPDNLVSIVCQGLLPVSRRNWRLHLSSDGRVSGELSTCVARTKALTLHLYWDIVDSIQLTKWTSRLGYLY